MSRKHLTAILYMGMVLVLGSGTVAAQQGVVSIDQVSNLIGPSQVRAGENIRFLLRINNNTGLKVDISNGFRLHAPDGATWDSTTVDTAGENISLESKFGLFFDIAFALTEAGCDGIGSDTVGVLGAGNPTKSTRQLPNGYNDTSLAITAWFHTAVAAGKRICIDTCFVQPGGTWKWVKIEGGTEYAYYPLFRGLIGQTYTPNEGYCFQIADLPTQLCRVIHVPGDFATIQAAINGAKSCDTVQVAPGVYQENISLMGKPIVVRSSGGPEATTLRGTGQAEAVVLMSSGEPKGAEIRGFTITGGKRGGIYCAGSSPTIRGNIITGNLSSSSDDGAGVGIVGTTGALVTHNKIYGNQANTYGAAIAVGSNGSNNSSDTICYNIAYDNTGYGDIRILGLLSGSGLHIYNNTIIVTTYDGIALQGGGSADVRNNIVTSSPAWGIYKDQGNMVADYNCLFANATAFAGVTPGVGNIIQDPLFVDAANHDYRLQAGSPCIDAGDPSPSYNDPDGTRNDIGALPFPEADGQCLTLHVPGDFVTIQAAVSAAGDCDTVLVHPGIHYVPQLVIEKPIVVRSSDGPLQTTITTDPSTDMIIFRGAAANGAVFEGFTLDGGHIGIWCQNAAPIIRGNILRNQTIDNWAALVVSGPTWGSPGVSPAVIVNNTIVHSVNGGISSFSIVPPTIKNNIIAFNDHYGIHNQNYSQPLMSYNDIYGNPGYSTANIFDLGPGALAVDPMFATDFTLMAGSPCIDAGDPNAIYNDPNGSRNDMGAIPFAGSGPADFINLIQWKKTFGGNDHWYGLIPRPLYWVEADNSAKRFLPGAEGLGYLATITSEPENRFILDSVVARTYPPTILDHFWLGGRDIQGYWTWITGEPFVYTNWGTGEPNNVGIETALGMWGPSTDEPGTFNNALPDSSVNKLHKFWSVVEWGPITSDTIPPAVSATNEWVLAYCAVPKLDRGLVPPGSIITAYDPAGVLCGAAKTKEDGSYGLMPIYRDDPYTRVDEGCQPGDIISFKINRAPVFAQPQVTWTRNGDRFEVCQFLTQKCQEIHLHTGWNLISWNVAYEGDIRNLIAPIRDQVDLVLAFDRGALAFDPDLVQFSTLHQIDYSHGYWFKMNGDATLRICGGYINQFNNMIPIYQGWNLVSYWPDAPWSVRSALMTVMANLQVAIGYDMGIQVYAPGHDMYNTLTQLKPGFGYWIRSSAPDYLEYFFMPTAGASENSVPVAVGGNDIASRDWMSLYGKDITLDGQPLAENTTIEAFTNDGARVGQSVYTGGILKFMPVYGYDGDDANAARYPKEGDLVNLFVNGVKTEPAVEWHGSGTAIQLSSLATATQLPGRYALSQNFPNPFNPSTKINFDLPKLGHVRLTIYNLLGQRIRRLTERDYDAGQHAVDWDSRNDNGEAVASGVYLYRLEAGSFVATKKMMLLK